MSCSLKTNLLLTTANLPTAQDPVGPKILNFNQMLEFCMSGLCPGAQCQNAFRHFDSTNSFCRQLAGSDACGCCASWQGIVPPENGGTPRKMCRARKRGSVVQARSILLSALGLDFPLSSSQVCIQFAAAVIHPLASLMFGSNPSTCSLILASTAHSPVDATQTERSCSEALVRKEVHQRGVGCKGEPRGLLGCGGEQKGVFSPEIPAPQSVYSEGE